VKRRKRREPRRGRIEIIPMIDVMFFLLATFMLASLVMQNLNSLPVNLPKGEAQRMNTDTSITLTVTRDSSIFINHTPVTLSTLAAALKPLLQDPSQSIIVSADNDAHQGTVVQAMLQARTAGAEHFLIAVKHE
jgi:biopolymer transport protein ExbD